MHRQLLRKRIAVASGSELADTVVRNGKIINVFTGNISFGDLAIVDGFFAGIGSFKGHEEIDAKGKYICPTFIDGHVHIESSMATPVEFAKVLLPHGVTSVIADPHEIANVLGTAGIDFMLNASKGIPFDCFFMLPSCVPATPFETSGATLENEDIALYYNHPKVLGLAEVMNAPAVRSNDPKMLEKLLTAQKAGVKIDGHAAGLDIKDINTYMAASIKTDHECISVAEAKERLERGMYVMIREGTVAKNLLDLIPLVNDKNSRRFLFVSDDKHLDDLIKKGSVNYNVALAIKAGLPPVTAIQMASLNVAECFGLSTKGAVAPGYEADFMFFESFDDMNISHVFKSGKLVAINGKVEERCFTNSPKLQKEITNSVNHSCLTEIKLEIPLKNKNANIIEIIPNSLVTNHVIESVKLENGKFTPCKIKDQLKLAVIERHKQTDNIGLGIVKGLQLKSGALATTIAHDSHNLIIAGTNDKDMLLAADEIERIQGGLVVVKGGEILASLALPIAGLMSNEPYEVINEKLNKIHEALSLLEANPTFNPFLTLSFLALPVIPHLKLTDKGLFDVTKFKHIDISVNKES
ncbi:adenine deaminase [Lottiidibacillus patelloidae]|uniref:Adenine deaminase n=1 Tax=Lottiidibacillus patelloidae TaxID=2670334 RepID=A0A263BRA6_9BACI|nr:adenine deaminase [Lottiidibacillus patelloidae]OZM56239.1 adenine deaminase [Lottiidibacillus patelloidae]